MKKGEIIENVTVEKLVFGGKGFARLQSENPDIDGRVLMITGGPVPGAIVNLRLLKKRKNYFETQIVETIKKSPIEIEHPTNTYGMSGGWKWINIPYEEQLKIKQEQVEDSLRNLQKIQENIPYKQIVASPTVDGYRNKVEFSYGKYLSKKYDVEQHFNVGFHKQGEFSKIEDMEGCPLIDEIQNDIYREIKQFSKTMGLPVYDQMRQEGFFRHILIRKTHFANQMMLLLSFNPEYFEKNEKLDKNEKLNILKDFLLSLTKKYPIIHSIYFSHNPNKADVCIGDLELIYGEATISESLLDLNFQISPTSFFQTNSSGAETLYSLVLDLADKDSLKDQTVLDLYGGTGTIGMIFAKHGAKDVHSVELVTSASKDGEKNAKFNNISNMSFVNAKVEVFLDDYLAAGNTADLLVIDPPRAGMHPDALPNILKFGTNQIIYVSCNPSTLARDLEYILQNSDYEIETVQAMDMFPHTNHIETLVSLKKKK
ncbi:MAG: 23S rRNA (uracil(1939)-C(5))-methyltransferase RlmD [Candidatus Gracilibacteria bacterium]|nr:23S rRNA (uracil(1939)-C(5))-methyltransferase RlmD [Candidatus Gracilibacteria bacterium]